MTFLLLDWFSQGCQISGAILTLRVPGCILTGEFVYMTGILALRPKLFLVDVVLCMAIILQGTWLFQIGLFLYVEEYIPQGCHYRLDLPTGIDGSTICDVEVARVRAVALMDLAFNCHVICVVLFSVLAFALVAKLSGSKRVGYDSLILESDPESVQMKPLPKLHFDRRVS